MLVTLCAATTPTEQHVATSASTSGHSPNEAVNELNTPCPRGAENRKSDLCAQWKSADAASEAARWTAHTFWLSLVGTVVGAGTLIAAFLAARYAKNAAGEARRAADIARDSFIANERAWLTVELHPDGALTFYETGGCELPVYLTIKNLGRTPALNVHTSMTMVPMRQDHIDEVAEYAAEQRERNTTWRRTLLPGDSYDRRWGPSLDDYTQAPYATILGCVTYETLPDRALHQTAFCYIVGRGEVGSLDGFDVPKEEVRFTVTSGGFAD